MSAYDEIVDALNTAGCKQTGHDWTCPVHKGGAERSPSLSVNPGDKGVVMICQAGCNTDDVLRFIGKKPSDLFDNKTEGKKIAATYDYKDRDGNLIYQVVRYEPKEFRQRQPDGAGGWKWTIKGVDRVPYRLPEVLAAIKEGKTINVVEGEKDADRLWSIGEPATCNSGGAGKWPADFAQFFEGCNVRVIRDNDEAGQKHADIVYESLNTKAFVSVLAPAKGKDISDHLNAGLGMDALVSERNVGESVERENPLNNRLLKIDEVDNLPAPQYLIEDFIAADTLAVLYGLPGHGKSFVALDWALSMAHGLDVWMTKKVMQGPVLYLVAEGLSGYGIRKRSWRKEHPVYTEGELQWLRDPVNLLDTAQVKDLIDLCNREQPMLIVIDTLARCMPGADENAPGPISLAIEALDTIRRETRACVLIVHHSTKEGAGGPRGHSALLGAVQSSIRVTLSEGMLSLSVEKQKDGAPVSMNLRLQANGESAVLMSMGDGPISISRSIVNERSVLKALSDFHAHGGASASTLIDATGIAKTTILRVLTTLMEEQRVAKVGPRYVLIAPNV